MGQRDEAGRDVQGHSKSNPGRGLRLLRCCGASARLSLATGRPGLVSSPHHQAVHPWQAASLLWAQALLPWSSTAPWRQDPAFDQVCGSKGVFKAV